jgi:hypothetical protein
MNITGKDIGFYLLLILLAVFGYFIVLKQVNAESSYGLHEIIAIFAVIAGAYMQGYVGERRSKSGPGQDTADKGK